MSHTPQRLHHVRCLGMSEDDMALIEKHIAVNPLYERDGFNANGDAA